MQTGFKYCPNLISFSFKIQGSVQSLGQTEMARDLATSHSTVGASKEETALSQL